MKINNPCRLALLAMAGALIPGLSAQAATVSYTNGDLFLGFRASGGVGATHSYLIDIGQASLYRDATTAFTLNVGNLGLDLNAIYGLGAGNSTAWYNRSDLTWAVVGSIVTPGTGGDVTNTQYGSKGETTFGTTETPWARRANSSQQSTTTKFQSLSSAFNGATSTGNSNFAVDQNGTTNSWSAFFPGGSQYSGGVEFANYTAALEGSFANGASGAALDLFSMAPSSSGGAGTLEGTFTINTSGQATFTAAVPEPGSLAMLSLGGCFLGFIRRRRPTLA